MKTNSLHPNSPKVLSLITMMIMLFVALSGAFAQSVSINTTGVAPDASAILDLSSTTKGMLLPRMTTVQRNSISSPAIGLLVYDITLQKFYLYSSTGWTALLSGSNSVITDLDNNTKVDVEETVNNNEIRFKINGATKWVMKNNSLEPTSNNIAIGGDALLDAYIDRNIAIGNRASRNCTGCTGNIAIGDSALYSNQNGPRNVAIGQNALKSHPGSFENVAIGTHSLTNYNSSGALTAIGSYTLRNNTTGAGNTAVGYESLTSNTTGNWLTAVGHLSLKNNTTGNFNVAIGFETMKNNTTGSHNTAVGTSALQFNTTGSDNTAMGQETLNNNTTGYSNTAIGPSTLNSNTSGYENTGVGNAACWLITTGSANTGVGYHSIYISTGSGNTAIGHKTLLDVTTGGNNTGVGRDAGPTFGAATNTVSVGYNSRANANNLALIGNSSMVWIGGQVGWSAISDARIKQNVRADIPGLSFIKQLHPVSYTLDIEKQNDILGLPDDTTSWSGKYDIQNIRFSGFLAQEVEAAAKSIGYDFSGVDAPKEPNQMYSLRYSDFVMPLVKAVQELSVENELLKAQLAELSAKVEVIMNRPQ